EASDTFCFLRPFWNRLAIPPWLLSLLVLAILAAARFYSAFGPPQARILFLLHILVMWMLPFLFLTRQGRRDIGLRRQGITPVALVLSSLAGVAGGLFIFWIGMALYGNSPDNWCVSIRNSFQLNRMLTVMSPAARICRRRSVDCKLHAHRRGVPFSRADPAVFHVALECRDRHSGKRLRLRPHPPSARPRPVARRR